MKRALLAILSAIALRAQPAVTTVADTIYSAVGTSYCSGTFVLKWAQFLLPPTDI